LANNIGGIIVEARSSQYWANIVPNIYLTQYLPNIVQHVLPILVQYYGQYWPEIGQQYWWNTFEEWNSQYCGDTDWNIGPILLANIWPIENFIVNM